MRYVGDKTDGADEGKILGSLSVEGMPCAVRGTYVTVVPSPSTSN